MRGSLRGPLKISEISLKTSENLKKTPQKTSENPRQISLSEALSPVGPIHLPLKLSPSLAGHLHIWIAFVPWKCPVCHGGNVPFVLWKCPLCPAEMSRLSSGHSVQSAFRAPQKGPEKWCSAKLSKSVENIFLRLFDDFCPARKMQNNLFDLSGTGDSQCDLCKIEQLKPLFL